MTNSSHRMLKKKGKDIPVTGCGRPWGCESSRLPNFLDNRFTDGGKVVRLTRRTPFTPQEDSWYSFLLEAASSTSSKRLCSPPEPIRMRTFLDSLTTFTSFINLTATFKERSFQDKQIKPRSVIHTGPVGGQAWYNVLK
jgi:hypothetical protein